MHDDLYHIFRNFWWLVFPLFWMISALLRMNQHHDHTNKVLDLIKSYADQGKEAPPELLRALEQQDDAPGTRYGRRGLRRHTWHPVFLFAALCAGFMLFALWPGMDWDPRQMVSFFFVALVMAGLCIGNLVAVMLQDRRANPPQ